MKHTLAALLCAGLTGSVHAAVIQFDQPHEACCNSDGYREDGFRFDGHASFSNDDDLVRFARGSHSVMTRTDGSTFTLKAIELAEYSQVFEGRQFWITILGEKADGSFVSQSFQLDGILNGADLWDVSFQTFRFSTDFEGLVAAYFENTSAEYYNGALPAGFPSGFNLDPFTMDNLVVQSVPVPAAAWLFGSALGLLGWRKRRS